MNKLFERITTVIIGILIVSFSVVTVISNIISPKTFSENENRELAVMPELKIENVRDTTYMKDLTDYLTDHFVLRESFMSLYTTSQKLLNKSLISGVYICDDGYLIEQYKTPENTDKIIRKWNALADKLSIKADVMLIPTSITINSNKLPTYANKGNQLETLDKFKYNLNMNVIDITASLDGYDNMFYRTDHHWTTYGAYNAYVEFCKQKGFEAQKLDDFKITDVTDSFYGSVYSKVIDNSVKPDTITTFLQPDNDITVSFSHRPTVNSLYNEDYLNKKDKYSYFLNNQNDIIEIHNNKLDNSKKLLVVRDSYANCFVPFLVNHYEDIVVLDTRYYFSGVSNYINTNNVTDLLILYNLNTLDSETGIAGIY